MKKRPAAVAAASQSSFLTRPPSGSEETRVLMPRAFHLAKLETGCEKTPMTNAGGDKGIAPPLLRPNVILTNEWKGRNRYLAKNSILGMEREAQEEGLFEGDMSSAKGICAEVAD